MKVSCETQISWSIYVPVTVTSDITVVRVNRSLARGSILNERDLEELIVHSEPGHLPIINHLEEAIGKAGISINVVMEIGSREAVWLAVAKGIGISVVSDIEFIPHEDLKAIEISDSDIHTIAHVACLTERKDSRLIGAFLETAQSTKAPSMK